MTIRHETNYKVQWCCFITQFMMQDWFKCLRKKEEIVSVFVCNGKAEEAEKSFSSDWAENLAESTIKGSYFRHINIQCKAIKNSRKLQLKNLLKIWKAKTLKHGKSFSRRRPCNKSVICHFCQGSVELVENVRTWLHLDFSVIERKLSVARN